MSLANTYIKDSLKDWGITVKQARTMLQATRVTVHLKYPNTDEWIKIQPKERKGVLRKFFNDELFALKNDFTNLSFDVVDKKVEPRRVTTQLELKQVFKLLEKNYVGTVNIEQIEGFTKILSEKADESIFYSVKAKFGIKIEGIESGLQGWEEKIILLRATNYTHAYAQAFKILSQPNKPYLNSNKRFVWWQFEEILDVYETSIQQVSDFEIKGIEVFSKMHNRRLKPPYVWKIDYEK